MSSQKSSAAKPAPEPDAETYAAPPSAPDLEPRAPAPEEFAAEWEPKPEPEPAPLEAAAAVVDMLEAMAREAGEPEFATWERAALIWSLEGLDVSAVNIPQPTRAIVGVGAITAGRVLRRKRAQRAGAEPQNAASSPKNETPPDDTGD